MTDIDKLRHNVSVLEGEVNRAKAEGDEQEVELYEEALAAARRNLAEAR